MYFFVPVISGMNKAVAGKITLFSHSSIRSGFPLRAEFCFGEAESVHALIVFSAIR